MVLTLTHTHTNTRTHLQRVFLKTHLVCREPERENLAEIGLSALLPPSLSLIFLPSPLSALCSKELNSTCGRGGYIIPLNRWRGSLRISNRRSCTGVNRSGSALLKLLLLLLLYYCHNSSSLAMDF